MPAIEDLIENKKESNNKFTFCDLKDEGKPISSTSERILNCKSHEKVIYANKKIRASKSIDFTQDCSDVDVDDESFTEKSKTNRKEIIRVKKLKPSGKQAKKKGNIKQLKV